MLLLLDCRMAGWSGVGRYATGLARALAARGDIDLVQVCAAGEPPPVEAGPRTQVLAAAAHPLGFPGAIELGRLAVKVGPDIIHCPHFPTPAPVRRPLVVTLHDLIPLRVPGVMPSASRRALYRHWNSRAVRVADRLVAPSRSTAADLENLFPAARGKVEVIPEAADDFAAGPAGTLSGRLAHLASTPFLLTMGNTKPHKDLPTLLRAFARMAPSAPDLRLVLVGTEPPGYLDRQLPGTTPEVRARVAFADRVDDAELRALYAGAVMFICPSVYEGFGLPALEAMALGAPVVCANAASLPEVVAEAALLFPAGDPDALAEVVTHVLRDPTLRNTLSRDGRERASLFAWASTASATVAVYREVLRGATPGRSRGGDAT